MSDIEQFIEESKAKDPKGWAHFETKYRTYKIGMQLAAYRERSGYTLTRLAKAAKMQKTALSRLENHGDDVRLSTIIRLVEATGKPMAFRISPSSGQRSKARATVELQPA